jgi:hypothetical protein
VHYIEIGEASGGQENHGYAIRVFIFFNLSAHIEPIHIGQVDIQKDQVRVVGSGQL